MFKVNDTQYTEGGAFYHRTFRSGLHDEFDGEVPALNLFNDYRSCPGANAVRMSSHRFDGIVPGPVVLDDGRWRCRCGRVLGDGVAGCAECYRKKYGEDPPREWLFF